MAYDPSQITYTGYTKNAGLWDNFIVNAPGYIAETLDTIFAAGFADYMGPGIFLDDDEVLFTLIFTQNGLSSTTYLNWILDGEFDCELWPYTAGFVLPFCDTPVEYCYDDGSVTLVSNPTCSIDGNDGPVCPGTSHSYTASPGLDYAWSIDGNGEITGPADEQTVSVLSGTNCYETFTLTLVVTNSYGCTSQCDKTVEVSAPLLSVNCPGTVEITACTDAAVINTEFTSWLSGFSYSGGCNTQVSGLAGVIAPDICGGNVDVTYSAIDDCGQYAECASSFSVQYAPPVVLNCPAPAYEDACQSQTAIDGKFQDWLNSVDYSGGCNTLVSNDAISAPPACGGNVTVTWTAESDCEPDQTCSSTFTVADAPLLSVNCPADLQFSACGDQDVINDAFYTWINTFSYNGACNTQVTDLDVYSAPDACTGGSVDINYIATDDCGQSTSCTSHFIVDAAYDLLS